MSRPLEVPETCRVWSLIYFPLKELLYLSALTHWYYTLNISRLAEFLITFCSKICHLISKVEMVAFVDVNSHWHFSLFYQTRAFCKLFIVEMVRLEQILQTPFVNVTCITLPALYLHYTLLLNFYRSTVNSVFPNARTRPPELYTKSRAHM